MNEKNQFGREFFKNLKNIYFAISKNADDF